jgi:hypothetical protein
MNRQLTLPSSASSAIAGSLPFLANIPGEVA